MLILIALHHYQISWTLIEHTEQSQDQNETNLSCKKVHVSIAWGRSCFVACTCKLYMLARISMQRTGEQDRCVESVAGIPFKMDAQAGH